MQINIDTNKPWISQLKKLENELIEQALRQSKGNKAEASRLLGIGESTLKKRINKSAQFREVVKQSKPKPIEVVNKVPSILSHFLLGLSIKEISEHTKCQQSKIMDLLSDKLGVDNCKVIQKNNEQLRSMQMNTEQIIENNRQLLAIIAESIREKKELSPENLVYAKILYNNGFINEKGEVTEEGKEALYH